MAKRKPMGAAGDALFNRGTGMDALAAAAGAPPPARGKGSKVKAPRQEASPRVSQAPPAVAAAVEPAPRYMVTTIRLRPEHLEALRVAAIKRATTRGAGKADASEVLREILDGWMASGVQG